MSQGLAGKTKAATLALLASALLASCAANHGGFTTRQDVVERPAVSRVYRPYGNGFVGGIGWLALYSVPPGADASLRRRMIDVFREQSAAAGQHYSEKVDLGRYNFVAGLAASTDRWSDLIRRVILDQARGGPLPELKDPGYASLVGKKFVELGCHSNGAMICLLALTRQDVQADNVVLYGPQITPKTLEQWNSLLSEGEIHSLHASLP